MTDREKAGLRSPARIRMQECEHRGVYRHSTETIYDVVENLLAIRSIHLDSQDWVSTGPTLDARLTQGPEESTAVRPCPKTHQASRTRF